MTQCTKRFNQVVTVERKGEESKKGTFESKFGPQPFFLCLCTLSMSYVSGFNTLVKSLPKSISILPASPSNSHPVFSFACQSLHWASQGTTDKEPACQCRRQCKRCVFDAWGGKIPWRRAWQPTPVFMPGESHGQRSLVGYGSYGRRFGHN